MPWDFRIWSRRFCSGRNSSSRKLGVPRPSWLVTMTKVQPASRRRSNAGTQSGSRANLSRRSIWKSAGSVMSVPSRSMNRIFLDTGKDLQGGVVLGGGADGDADGVGNILAAVAPDDA